MGRLQLRYEGEQDEALSTLNTCAERAVIGHGASTKLTARRSVVVLQILAALTGSRGVSAQAGVETPSELCIQEIQTAIIDRTGDLFQDIYLPNHYQVCLLDICMRLRCDWLYWFPRGTVGGDSLLIDTW